MSRDWQPEEDDFSEALHRRTEELYTIPDAVPDEDGFIECAVLPLRDIVIFPRMVSPLFIGRSASLLAVKAARTNHQTAIALTQGNPMVDNPGPGDLFMVGTELAVGRLLKLQDGSSSALVQGRRRVEIIEFTQTKPFLAARARVIEDPVYEDDDTDTSIRTALSLFEKYTRLNPAISEEAHLFVINIEQPGWLADSITSSISLDLDERQGILSEIDPLIRLNTVIDILERETHILEVENQIHHRTQTEMSRTQREIYLREQLRVIQSELGEGDSWTQEISELRSKIEAANLPEEVELRALKEVGRVAQLPPISPEVGVIRTYLEWILDLPWSAKTEDNLDVLNAAKVLDENHYGLRQVKDRILEHIAVMNLKPEGSRAPIICLVGPPGTGKTSLGRSIAAALNKNFVRISLGGVRDEAEIRGHRRTYIGALPGRILQTMRRAETINPLFMLDEIDKLSSDYRGDPSSAMLEVLDPEQNNSFSDHYLELPYDLSKTMFITTANWAGRIPAPLYDRMEIIELPGYTEEEKLEIASNFLIPRQIVENGLKENEIKFEEASLRHIIRLHTYEAGVRNLEREIGKICRKIARLKAEKKRYPQRITEQVAEKLLGPPEFSDLEAERKDEIGVATALAWTENGGDIMPVEVLLYEGKGNLQITGQIGEVMQESAQAALSYIKSRARAFKIKAETFENMDIHLHFPEGGIPKDGPSAGVTMTTALISAFTKRKVRKGIAMTGEITLRGRVLPVGGIREKVLAAHRAGIKTVVLPEKNKKNLVDVHKKIQDDLEIIFVDHIDKILEIALHEKKPRQAKKPATQPAAKPAASQQQPPAGA